MQAGCGETARSAEAYVIGRKCRLTALIPWRQKTDMSLQSEIDLHTRQLIKLAPKGYFFTLHIRYAMPVVSRQTYPQAWIDHYSEQAYALRDPLIAWGFSTEGTARWNEITIPDPFDIMGQARAHGMVHGLAVSMGPMNSRTIASAARDDREFTDAEIGAFAAVIRRLHQATEPPASITPAQIQALRCIAAGDRHAAAAAKLGISESALKARLAAARETLHARTTTEAIQRARDYRLI